jgi:hypothetical protein
VPLATQDWEPPLKTRVASHAMSPVELLAVDDDVEDGKYR